MVERPGTGEDPRVRVMTVARVREVAGRDTDVMFNESARIYRLARRVAGYDGLMRLLHAVQESGARVRVRLSEPHGDVIEQVEAV